MSELWSPPCTLCGYEGECKVDTMKRAIKNKENPVMSWIRKQEPRYCSNFEWLLS